MHRNFEPARKRTRLARSLGAVLSSLLLGLGFQGLVGHDPGPVHVADSELTSNPQH